MGITIHYYTEADRGLDPATAEAKFEKAVSLTRMIAAQFGWKFRGRFREKQRAYTEYGPKGGSRSGTGTVRMALWDPDPGCETFSLEWVEGTGILPYCFVKTQYSHDRVRVHTAIVTLLDRLNRFVFDGKLVIHDEGGFLENRSVDTLAAGFAENEAIIRSVLKAVRARGWQAGSPLDDDASRDTSAPRSC